MIDDAVREGLIEIANKRFKDKSDSDSYQTIGFFVYEADTIKEIFKLAKFKDIGNIYDYPDLLPKPKYVSGYDISINFESFQRIAISKKFKSIVLYNFQEFIYYCVFLVNTKKLKKFTKIIKSVIQKDSSQINVFKDIDFKCKPGEYIEVSKFIGKDGDSFKPVSAVKKKVIDETLVFDDKSTLNEVIKDITSFFTDETRELYEKLDIHYKRGIILYGDPGQGKSAMIREIIRKSSSDISRIVIHPNVSYEVTYVLSSLLKALNGMKAIIILEDLDSLISETNRSEFLNILDGIDIKSGVYIIATTNYPDRIDPAFVNRSGRFDRTYKIDNPSEQTRRLFFESRKVEEILSDHANPGDNIVELFTKHSEGLPMASLKEVITSTKYLLASNPEMSLENAIIEVCGKLRSDKIGHMESHEEYVNKSRMKHMVNSKRPITSTYMTFNGNHRIRKNKDGYVRNERGYIAIFTK